MPRIDCRPDVVFPELLEARLIVPAEGSSAERLLAVIPLKWDWLGWGQYAVPIERGNCHAHLNLTCRDGESDGFGLHLSLFGQTRVSEFLEPVAETADPLRLEFALDVPGVLLAEREEMVPLRIEITAATGQLVDSREPYPWPLYGMVSGYLPPSDDDIVVNLAIDSNNDGMIDANDDVIEENPPGKIMLYIDNFPCIEDVDPPDCPTPWPKDLARCELSISSSDSMFDINDYTLMLSVTGSMIVWRDAARTSQVPIGYAVPAGSGQIPNVFYLEATAAGDADIEVSLLDANQRVKARDKVKAKGVVHQVSSLKNVLTTKKLEETFTDTIRNLSAADKEAAIKDELVDAIHLDQIHQGNLPAGLEGYEITGIGPTELDPTKVNGFAGMVVAWSIDARANANNQAYDFSRVKVRCMPYSVVWQNAATAAGRKIAIRHPNTNQEFLISKVPADTKTHEFWHTNGVPADFYTEANQHGIGFLSYEKASLPNSTINKPGISKGCSVWSDEATARLKLAPIKKQPTTDQDAREIAEDIVNRYLTGAAARATIVQAGTWHTDVEEFSGNWGYNRGNWHPKDFP